jgi:hypothetical protein
VFEEYQAMPHCFAMLLPGLEGSERCVKSWGGFAKKAVEEGEGAIETQGTWIEVKTGREESRVVQELSRVSFEEAGRLVREAKGKRLGGTEGEAKGLAKAAL